MEVKKEVLPYKFPPVTSYPYQANLLSVILNYEKAYPWYYNQFVLLESPKKNDFGMRIDFYSSLLWKTCPWIYYQRISREMVKAGWESIIDFIRQSIDRGFYVYFTVDRYYISAYGSYNAAHCIHDIFIYGYDDETKKLNAADNFRDGKYSCEVISYDELKLGYENITRTSGGAFEGEIDWLNGIELISFREKYSCDFDINRFIDDLKDYLYSTNHEKKMLET